MQRSLHGALIGLLLGACCCAQNRLGVSLASAKFEIVAGGPFGPRQSVVISTDKAWSAKADADGAWLSITPDKGTGRTSVVIGLNSDAGHHPPGNLASKITFTAADGATGTVAITLHIVPHLPDPLFSYGYPDGPKSCVAPPGYPDPALCTVPDEKPPGNFAPPKPGASYSDPNFGGRVRVLAPPRSLHGYSAPSVFSATAKYALISQDGLPTIVEVATGKQQGGHMIPIEGPMWDLHDDETLYFLSGPLVRKYNIRSKKLTTLVDYSKAPYRFTAIKTGSRGDTSKDNWIAFEAPQESNLCALDLTNVKTYCTRWDAAYGGVTLRTDNGGAIIAKGVDSGTGKRYVILVGRPIAVFSVNAVSGFA